MVYYLSRVVNHVAPLRNPSTLSGFSLRPISSGILTPYNQRLANFGGDMMIASSNVCIKADDNSKELLIGVGLIGLLFCII